MYSSQEVTLELIYLEGVGAVQEGMAKGRHSADGRAKLRFSGREMCLLCLNVKAWMAWRRGMLAGRCEGKHGSLRSAAGPEGVWVSGPRSPRVRDLGEAQRP